MGQRELRQYPSQAQIREDVGVARLDHERIHDEAIVIDAVSPLAMRRQYIDWYIEGGATATAPTIAVFEGAGPTLRILGDWIRAIDADPRLTLVKRAADFAAAKADGKFGVLFHFQGTGPIEDDLNLIDAYKALGVGMIQLAYNIKNSVGDGCEERTDAGLSYFGLQVVERLNEARVVVDCTHTGYRTTMDAIEASTRPVVFSHSNPKAVKESARNIRDEQIKAAAATGGLIGMVGFPAFVSASPRPTLDEFIDHIDYVVKLVGDDHVGLGIDYYWIQAAFTEIEEATRLYEEFVSAGKWRPDSYPPPPIHYVDGIETPCDLRNLTRRLLERGYSEEATKKILGGNWVRVFREVWGE